MYKKTNKYFTLDALSTESLFLELKYFHSSCTSREDSVAEKQIHGVVSTNRLSNEMTFV